MVTYSGNSVGACHSRVPVWSLRQPANSCSELTYLVFIDDDISLHQENSACLLNLFISQDISKCLGTMGTMWGNLLSLGEPRHWLVNSIQFDSYQNYGKCETQSSMQHLQKHIEIMHSLLQKLLPAPNIDLNRY